MAVSTGLYRQSLKALFWVPRAFQLPGNAPRRVNQVFPVAVVGLSEIGSVVLGFRPPASQPDAKHLGLRLSYPFLAPAVQLGLGARVSGFLA